MVIAIAAASGGASFQGVGCFLYVRGSRELTPCEFDWLHNNCIAEFDPLGGEFVTYMHNETKTIWELVSTFYGIQECQIDEESNKRQFRRIG